MEKFVEKNTLKPLFVDGMSLMVGGFMGCGTPEGLIDLVMDINVQNLTIIANDTAFVDVGVGRLIANGQVKKVIASHIGLNPEVGRLMNENKIEVELVPQGTLIESIRAGGSGLGGFLTPTGVGTIVEEGKEKIILDGIEYLLELPIKADMALIRGSVSDKNGNTYYKGTTRNFNPIIALACDKVIVEAMEIVEVGQIKPEDAMTPCVLVDYVVKGELL